MAAVQRTLLGGECMAALWLYDAQIQKHVSHTNSCSSVCLKASCRCVCLSARMDGQWLHLVN